MRQKSASISTSYKVCLLAWVKTPAAHTALLLSASSGVCSDDRHRDARDSSTCCVAVFLSIVSCILYVYETYDPEMRDVGWWEALELVFGTFFGADYVFRFYLARDKMRYFFEPMPMIDFVTVVPTFIYVAVQLQGQAAPNTPPSARNPKPWCLCSVKQTRISADTCRRWPQGSLASRSSACCDCSEHCVCSGFSRSCASSWATTVARHRS